MKEGVELWSWVIGLSVSIGGLSLLGLALWAERHRATREAREAEVPYAEVEPPRTPSGFRYVDAEESGRNIHEGNEGRPSDPQVGDLVTACVVDKTDAEERSDRLVARVVWPRETYVRARLVSSRPGGLSEVVDIPRAAIITSRRLTG